MTIYKSKFEHRGVKGTYIPRRMTGRCASGAEADGGKLDHAVKEENGTFGRAACGARPGRGGNGWSYHAGEVVDCPRCLLKVTPIIPLSGHLPADCNGGHGCGGRDCTCPCHFKADKGGEEATDE